ncbi:MAG: hypothetical protein ACLFUS_17200, partial [Candidatus Sumerlaeia bacterium]
FLARFLFEDFFRVFLTAFFLLAFLFFFSTFFTLFLADFFFTAFLALFFTDFLADFLTAFLAVFLTAFWALFFLASLPLPAFFVDFLLVLFFAAVIICLSIPECRLGAFILGFIPCDSRQGPHM